MRQVDRVERALRKHGRINTTDFLAPHVIDEGKPILRLAARIHDLQDEGFKIRSERKLNGTVDYILGVAADQAEGAEAGAEPVAGHAGSAVGAPDALFEPPPATPVRGVLEDYEAA